MRLQGGVRVDGGTGEPVRLLGRRSVGGPGDREQAKGRGAAVRRHTRHEGAPWGAVPDKAEVGRDGVAHGRVDEHVAVGQGTVGQKSERVVDNLDGEVVADGGDPAGERGGLAGSDVVLGVVLPHQKAPCDGRGVAQRQPGDAGTGAARHGKAKLRSRPRRPTMRRPARSRASLQRRPSSALLPARTSSTQP